MFTTMFTEFLMASELQVFVLVRVSDHEHSSRTSFTRMNNPYRYLNNTMGTLVNVNAA